ncbi:nucleotidyl transferase AbiEii/AbiGii toxin family protein [Capnocytophaga leadbetteri]|uniref:nucleotidyl transferase AbiEii/AbiGii toxin family protein n=1 Tax=Capnocytophaga leadbetteri TaxID=327575 RepID=UPI0026EC1369|nr:nucleotidyl transferase AbiEii/AbiGii toxin family protein [Capnocytophaga leadbetteri]
MNYFNLTPEQQKTVITQTAARVGLPMQAVEKDLWVTTLLQLLFTLSFANQLLFKGGTSLSKSYGLIHRFSEDIDLVIDRNYFGYKGDLTKKQIKQLRKQSSLFVEKDFTIALKQAIENFGLQKYCTIVVQPNGEGDNTYPEPRKIEVFYKSLFANIGYLQPKVVLEVGTRSLFEPTEPTQVKSLITSTFQQIETDIVSVVITTASPAKTFLEKAFLLHELFTTHKGDKAERKSRHLYDLEKMMDEPFAIEAISNNELWETIAHHRKLFTSVLGVDYTPDIRKRIQLIPPSNVVAIWEKDYREMQESMIYEDSLPFNTLLERIHILENRFHNIANL